MKKTHLMAALVLMALMGACSKNIDIHPPIDQLTTETIFSDSATAVAAVSGVYGMAIKANAGTMSFINGFATVLPGLSADELVTTATNVPFDEFAANAINPKNTLLLNNWSDAYAIIFQCNLIIENLDRNTTLTQTLKNQLGGEMRFMRAFSYFYLTNEYGRVPLIISPDYKVNTAVGNTDSAAIYRQIVKDLEEAQNMLVNAYPGPGTEKIRANKLAATALLARVHLYRTDYAKAAAEATAVINSNRFILTEPQKTFLANNDEAIMQLAPAIALFLGPAESYFLLPQGPTVRPSYQMRPELVNAFEAGDLRKTNWVGSNVVNGVTYHYLNKAKILFHGYGSPKPEYIIMLRLAEQYLIRAEAYANQNNLADAIKDLDKIRQRAGLPLIADTDPGISKHDLLAAIMQENRIEFFLEWGHRWFDLKRTGRASQVLAPLKGSSWQTADVLYPFPNNEILTAPNLKQNDGYAQ
jgi:starch-binding outer membrane protein, SusD/RagB family